MAITIKDEEASQLARRLANLTGESVSDAVVVALRERLQRELAKGKAGRLSDELLDIGRRCAALPLLDTRTPEEILGYDRDGLPR